MLGHTQVKKVKWKKVNKKKNLESCEEWSGNMIIFSVVKFSYESLKRLPSDLYTL